MSHYPMLTQSYPLQLYYTVQCMHTTHRPLLEYVRVLGIEGRQVTITGHSLGGGLARIVGSLAQLPSITFSPPGIAQSYRKFQVITL
jgi:predicted esterase YcpF (UPF0227 family)